MVNTEQLVRALAEGAEATRSPLGMGDTLFLLTQARDAILQLHGRLATERNRVSRLMEEIDALQACEIDDLK